MSLVDEMKAGILVDLDALWSSASEVGDVHQAIKLIGDVVLLIENRALELKEITGKQKKEIAVKVINAYVNIPVCPEWLEAKAISYAIDTAVDILNRYVGKLWGSVVGK